MKREDINTINQINETLDKLNEILDSLVTHKTSGLWNRFVIYQGDEQFIISSFNNTHEEHSYTDATVARMYSKLLPFLLDLVSKEIAACKEDLKRFCIED